MHTARVRSSSERLASTKVMKQLGSPAASISAANRANLPYPNRQHRHNEAILATLLAYADSCKTHSAACAFQSKHARCCDTLRDMTTGICRVR